MIFLYLFFYTIIQGNTPIKAETLKENPPGSLKKIERIGDTLFALTDKGLFRYSDSWEQVQIPFKIEDFSGTNDFFIYKTDNLFRVHKKGNKTVKIQLPVKGEYKLQGQKLFFQRFPDEGLWVYDFSLVKLLTLIPVKVKGDWTIERDTLFLGENKKRGISLTGQVIKRIHPRDVKILLHYSIQNSGEVSIKNPEIYFAIPISFSHQEVKEIVFNEEPETVIVEEELQPVAIFSRDSLIPEQEWQVKMLVRARLFDTRFYIDPQRVEPVPDSLLPYLDEDFYYQVKHPAIQEMAEKIKKKFPNPVNYVFAVLETLGNRIEYELEGEWLKPANLLNEKRGSCSEFAFLFSSILRAGGIPTRLVGATLERSSGVDFSFHRWVDVYLSPYGWVPFDPSAYKPEDNIFQQVNSYAYLPNTFLITTLEKGGSKFLGWMYNFSHKPLSDKVERIAFAYWEEE